MPDLTEPGRVSDLAPLEYSPHTTEENSWYATIVILVFSPKLCGQGHSYAGYPPVSRLTPPSSQTWISGGSPLVRNKESRITSACR